MRKYLYAGAVAGGVLLLGAAPAYADVVVPPPVAGQQPDGGPTGGILGPDGGLNLGNPLGDAKVLDVSPGDNTPDLTGAAGNVLPARGDVPAARTGLGQAGRRGPAAAAQPGADPAGSALSQAADGPLPTGGAPLSELPIGNLPIGNLLGGGLLGGGGGLLPAGRAAGSHQESGLMPSDLPLLGGGLGGLLPFSTARTLPAYSGMPAGGVPTTTQPAKPVKKPRPAAAPAQDPAVANDARLHEEPTDPEGRTGTTSIRKFSDGRPVAGVDPDYK
jgi:hypothetical protein